MGPLSSSTGRQSYKIHGLLNTTRLLGKRTLHHSWRGWSFAGQSRQAIKESMDESCCSSLGSCQYLPIKSVYSFWRTQNTLGKHFLTSVMCNMCNLQWEVHWNTFICDCRTRLRCPGGCGTWRKGLCRWPSHRWDRVPPWSSIGSGGPLIQLSTSGQAASSNSILIHLVLGRPTALVWEDRYQSNNIYICIILSYIDLFIFSQKMTKVRTYLRIDPARSVGEGFWFLYCIDFSDAFFQK